MLNRLFIIIGLLAILVLGGAFLGPAIWPWNDYRANLESLASETLGQKVEIEGDIALQLLPQPRLTLGKVHAASGGAALQADKVVIEFPLVDFLFDHYRITRMELTAPRFTGQIASDGSFEFPLVAGIGAPAGKVSVDAISFSDGAAELTDNRTGDTLQLAALSGGVQSETPSGALSIQAKGEVDGKTYLLRVTTGIVDPKGTKVSMTYGAPDNSFSVTAEGQLALDGGPRFTGKVNWRMPPPRGADAGQGAVVVSSDIVADTARLDFTNLAAVLDENRPATRLSGSATLTLGLGAKLTATLDSKLISLPKLSVPGEEADHPYELVGLLSGLPNLELSPVPADIAVTVAEFDLRGIPLRNLSLMVDADEDGWQIRALSARLPGDTQVTLSGRLSPGPSSPDFTGKISLASRRLDLLAPLWRKPQAGSPLYGRAGQLSANVNLVSNTLSLFGGEVALDNVRFPFEAQIGLPTLPLDDAATPGVDQLGDIHLTTELGDLDASQSAALFALLPKIDTDPAFAASFKRGEFDVTARHLFVDGLEGRGLRAKGSWLGGLVSFTDLGASELGGAELSFSGTAFGTFSAPEVTGKASVSVVAADAPILAYLARALGAPDGLEAFARRSLPIDLDITALAQDTNGKRQIKAGGTLGAVTLDAFTATLDSTLPHVFTDHVAATIALSSSDPSAMAAQLGLGADSIFGAVPSLRLNAQVDGYAKGVSRVDVALVAEPQVLSFSGTADLSAPKTPALSGRLRVNVDDPGPLLDRFGLSGFTLPALSAEAGVTLSDGNLLEVKQIAGKAEGADFGGELKVAFGESRPQISGTLTLPALSLDSLAAGFLGPAALLTTGGGAWPDGPLYLGDGAPAMDGSIALDASGLSVGGRPLFNQAKANLGFGRSGIELTDIDASAGSGHLLGEIRFCCGQSGGQATLNARLSGRDLPLATLLGVSGPPALAQSLSFDAQVGTAGGSIASLVAGLNGDGTYTLRGLALPGLDVNAIPTLVGAPYLIRVTPEEIAARFDEDLARADYTAEIAAGAFTIGAGTLRAPNLAIEGSSGRLFGSGALDLKTSTLTGSYQFTPASLPPDLGLDPVAAAINLTVGGTLMAPTRQVDASGLITAALAEAYDAELARQEKARAEEEALKKAAEEEAARLAAEQAAQAPATTPSAKPDTNGPPATGN